MPDTYQLCTCRKNDAVVDGLCAECVGKRIKELEEEVAACHTLLNGDASKIIQNHKDGYPEGRPDRLLTLGERIKALCTYAADWKRWCQNNEEKLSHYEVLMNPRRWTREMNDAWHKNLPDVQRAFDALSALDKP